MGLKEEKIINGIKAYFSKSGCKKAVLGLSGGVDSALTAALLAMALGKNNVSALIMPEKGLTLKRNVDDAVKLANQLGIRFYVQPIDDFLKDFNKLSWKRSENAKANAKARIRAMLLYDFANSNNALVAGTSNRTELLLGYFTKYGDGACDIEPIGSLYKTEVIKMAGLLKIPEPIVRKKPTAELYKGQTDEGELGAKYADIDRMLMKKIPVAKGIRLRIKDSGHKREMPFVVEV